MFIATTIQDTIRVEPSDFSKPSRQALQDNIHAKYANKVVLNVGLCVCLWDILEASDGLIAPGDGNVYIDTTFRMMVFRPFKGEVLEGTIVACTKSTIQIDVGFFDQIWVVAPEGLFDESSYDDIENTWIWTNDGSPFYFDKNEKVRFKVEEERFEDTRSEAVAREADKTRGAVDGVLAMEDDGGAPSSGGPGHGPYRILASMSQGGLGMVSWWAD